MSGLFVIATFTVIWRTAHREGTARNRLPDQAGRGNALTLCIAFLVLTAFPATSSAAVIAAFLSGTVRLAHALAVDTLVLAPACTTGFFADFIALPALGGTRICADINTLATVAYPPGVARAARAAAAVVSAFFANTIRLTLALTVDTLVLTEAGTARFPAHQVRTAFEACAVLVHRTVRANGRALAGITGKPIGAGPACVGLIGATAVSTLQTRAVRLTRSLNALPSLATLATTACAA